jgi:predicted aspartyl protease
LIAAMLAASAVQAQEPAPAPGGPRLVRREAGPPPQITGERADVAIRLVAGMPTIEAMINGRGPYRFAVDTGASGYLRVTPALAGTLGLRQAGEARAGDPSGGATVAVPLYRVDSLAFGGLSYGGIVASAINLPGSRLAGVDGIIGIGFFQTMVLTVDYGRLRLAAGPGALPEPNDRDVIGFTPGRGGLIEFPLRIGGAVHPVHLDTGNTRHPLFMPTAAIPGLPTRGQPRAIGTARTISQEIALQAVDLAAPVRIGSTTLPVTDVGYPAIAPVGNVGSLALQAMAVTIDYPNRRLRVVPSAR